METSELAKRERYQEVEKALMKLMEELEEMEDGDLKGLEQKIYQGVFELGRKLMQGRLNHGKEVQKAPGKIVGACGHEQHLVGYRPRQLLTVLGKVEWKRAYYQCQVEAGGNLSLWLKSCGPHDRKSTESSNSTVHPSSQSPPGLRSRLQNL